MVSVCERAGGPTSRSMSRHSFRSSPTIRKQCFLPRRRCCRRSSAKIAHYSPARGARSRGPSQRGAGSGADDGWGSRLTLARERLQALRTASERPLPNHVATLDQPAKEKARRGDLRLDEGLCWASPHARARAGQSAAARLYRRCGLQPAQDESAVSVHGIGASAERGNECLHHERAPNGPRPNRTIICEQFRPTSMNMQNVIPMRFASGC